METQIIIEELNFPKNGQNIDETQTYQNSNPANFNIMSKTGKIIGRNSFLSQDQDISVQHFKIVKNPQNEILINDCGSSNGTFLPLEKIYFVNSKNLQPEYHFFIGNTYLKIMKIQIGKQQQQQKQKDEKVQEQVINNQEVQQEQKEEQEIQFQIEYSQNMKRYVKLEFCLQQNESIVFGKTDECQIKIQDDEFIADQQFKIINVNNHLIMENMAPQTQIVWRRLSLKKQQSSFYKIHNNQLVRTGNYRLFIIKINELSQEQEKMEIEDKSQVQQQQNNEEDKKNTEVQNNNDNNNNLLQELQKDVDIKNTQQYNVNKLNNNQNSIDSDTNDINIGNMTNNDNSQGLSQISKKIKKNNKNQVVRQKKINCIKKEVFFSDELLQKQKDQIEVYRQFFLQKNQRQQYN